MRTPRCPRARICAMKSLPGPARKPGLTKCSSRVMVRIDAPCDAWQVPPRTFWPGPPGLGTPSRDRRLRMPPVATAGAAAAGSAVPETSRGDRTEAFDCIRYFDAVPEHGHRQHFDEMLSDGQLPQPRPTGVTTKRVGRT